MELNSEEYNAAHEASKKFKIVENKNAKTADELSELLGGEVGFGRVFADYMAHIKFKANATTDNSHLGIDKIGGAWTGHEIIPFDNISISPAAAVLHYAQEVFEGAKAYKRADGSIWLFRPELNAARFNASADRLALPNLPAEDFLGSIIAVVRQCSHWVPNDHDKSLYIRPLMIATEPFLGVRATHEADYYCILSPVAGYFGSYEPVNIWVSRDYHRSAPGGTGAAKTGGNYAASLKPAQEAYSRGGFVQMLYLDAANKENVEELGGMSLFVVYSDGHVETPRLNGQILDSITRRCIIQLFKDKGVDVRETTIGITKLVEDIKSGAVIETFACGTGAMASTIGRLASDDFDVEIGNPNEAGKVTMSIYNELAGIQQGTVPDVHNWCFKVM
ncbi:MAG: branched-chain amino acid aminotransferase [Candidatus Ancillula trichonymphae]|jgi:branched-chain amino acid aminotransferase|nr:branched-chain amino acid aminotransferase [Candidatus Ancillula trichonymphae]